MTKTRTQKITCERCERDKSPEKEQPLQHENQFSESIKNVVDSRDQSAFSPEGKSYEGDFGRSGTLNEFESGTRHARLDSPAQSHVTPLQYKSSMSPASKMEEEKMYTLGQAFFIVAGGLAIETKSFHEERYLTVTPEGAVELARLGLLSPIADEVINDKIKADPITKALVCIQAAWFIAQCISRVAHSLPLTLLEVHTLAHVLIAMSMYLVWFSKPYNALSPFIIVDPEIVQTAALFTLHDRRYESSSASIRCVLRDSFNTESDISAHFGPSSEEGPTHDSRSSLHVKEFGIESTSDRRRKDEHDLPDADQRGIEQVPTPHADQDDILPANLNLSVDRRRNTLNASPTSPNTFDSSVGEIMTVNSLPKPEQRIQSPGADTRAQLQSAYQNLGAHGSIAHASIVERQPNGCGPPNPDTHSMIPNPHADISLALAQLGAQRLKAAKAHFTYLQSADNFIEQRSTYLVPVIADFKGTPGCSLSGLNHPSKDKSSLLRLVYKALPSTTESHWLWLLFISYAALHLSAWNSHFPTTTERWMWRGAGLVILAGTALSLILLFLFLNTRNRMRGEDGLPSTNLRFALIQSLQLLTLLFLMIAMAASRLYFLVEAFVSLRAPAPRIYETVEWTNFWPHW